MWLPPPLPAGYDVDVVQFDSEGVEASVPAHHLYNHHYIFYITGQGGRICYDCSPCPGCFSTTSGAMPGHEHFAAAGRTDPLGGGRGGNRAAGMDGVPVLPPPLTPTDSSGEPVPRVQAFAEGAGNEYRLSFHGLPVGATQMVYSPEVGRARPRGAGQGAGGRGCWVRAEEGAQLHTLPHYSPARAGRCVRACATHPDLYLHQRQDQNQKRHSPGPRHLLWIVPGKQLQTSRYRGCVPACVHSNGSPVPHAGFRGVGVEGYIEGLEL